MLRHRLSLLATLLLNASLIQAQDVDLSEVVVSANRSEVGWQTSARTVTVIDRETIERAPVQTVNELLEYVTSLDIRQRGQNGVQADLSLRGSSFEQVLVLLNGIKMTDPQTGHHNMNLPIELMDIEKIEIIHGGASRVFGPGAFAGAINIITKSPDESKLKLNYTGGDNAFNELGGLVSLNFDKHSHTFSAMQRNSDGYIRNTDFEIQNLFWQSELRTDKGNWFFNIGQNEKSFGAQNFYTARFPEQFESTKTQFVSLGGKTEMTKVFEFSPRLYCRKHNDRFELFREGDGFYSRVPGGGFANTEGDTIPWYSGHNYHTTDVYGAEFSLSATTKFGVTSIGYDYRLEEIQSNVLGEPLDNPIQVPNEHPSAFYTRGANRTNQSVYLEHNATFNKFFISAGALFNWHSDFGEDILPGIDLSYQINERVTPFLSVNRSFRFPTYTDLYYNLGGAVGSIDLKPEYSTNYELGIKFNQKYGQGHISYFLRDGENLIDWIRFQGSDTTRAANITEVRISGIEVDYTIRADRLFSSASNSVLKTIRLGYTYLDSDTSSTDFESSYVLDFLQHKFNLGLGFLFAKNIYVDWNTSFQDRRGDYTNAEGEIVSYAPVWISDLRVAPRFKNVSLFIEVANLFDQNYVDIGNVQQPGRWFKLGVNFSFGLDGILEP